MSNDIRAMMDLINSLENGEVPTSTAGSSTSFEYSSEVSFQKSVIMEGILDALLGDIEGIDFKVFKNVIDIVATNAKQLDESTKLNKYSIVESKTVLLEGIVKESDHNFDENDNLSKTLIVDFNKQSTMSDEVVRSIFETLKSEKWVGRIGKRYNTVEELKESMKLSDSIILEGILGTANLGKWEPMNITFTPVVVESMTTDERWVIYGSQELKYVAEHSDLKEITGYIV